MIARRYTPRSGAERGLRLPEPLPVLIVGLVILLAWQLVATLYFNASVSPEFRAGAISGADPKVPPEMRVVMMKLPLPSLVLSALVTPENAPQLWLAGLITLRSAVIGFIVGGLTGFVPAVLMAQTRRIERSLLPYAIVSQMVPGIALGPIVYSIFKDENVARILSAAYVTFFPVTVTTLQGFLSLDPSPLG